jgi:hypothetical protein
MSPSANKAKLKPNEASARLKPNSRSTGPMTKEKV